MRAVLSAIIVGAVLMLMGCGATTEEKNTMKAQGDKITALEKTVGDLQKTNLGLKSKADSVEDYIKTHFKGYGEAEAPKGTETPAAKPPVKPAPAKKPTKAK
jgi:hypothetical protein